MDKFIRPISRMKAIELSDVEIDAVGGGANTDFYTRDRKKPSGDAWTYDGSKAD